MAIGTAMLESGISAETGINWNRCPRRRNLDRAGNRATLWGALRGRLLVNSSNILKYKYLN